MIPPEIALAVPAIGVLLEVLRRAELLADRFTPLTAVGLGVGVAVAVALTTDVGVLAALVGGVLAGGATVGLHQVPKQLSRGGE